MNNCKVEGCEKFVEARGLCIKHYKRLIRHGDVNYNPRPNTELFEKGLRKCTYCKVIKALKEFHKDRYHKTGLSNSCKRCNTAYVVFRKFKISKIEYFEMFKQQNNSCYICHRHEDTLPKRLCVDHDHKTGKVRKLLCDDCNVGLGRFFENPELFERASLYVKGEL